jgi:hypothetical protein
MRHVLRVAVRMDSTPPAVRITGTELSGHHELVDLIQHSGPITLIIRMHPRVLLDVLCIGSILDPTRARPRLVVGHDPAL